MGCSPSGPDQGTVLLAPASPWAGLRPGAARCGLAGMVTLRGRAAAGRPSYLGVVRTPGPDRIGNRPEGAFQKARPEKANTTATKSTSRRRNLGARKFRTRSLNNARKAISNTQGPNNQQSKRIPVATSHRALDEPRSVVSSGPVRLQRLHAPGAQDTSDHHVDHDQEGMGHEI